MILNKNFQRTLLTTFFFLCNYSYIKSNTIILIHGASSTGKTTIAKLLAKKIPNSAVIIHDDYIYGPFLKKIRLFRNEHCKSEPIPTKTHHYNTYYHEKTGSTKGVQNLTSFCKKFPIESSIFYKKYVIEKMILDIQRNYYLKKTVIIDTGPLRHDYEFEEIVKALYNYKTLFIKTIANKATLKKRELSRQNRSIGTAERHLKTVYFYRGSPKFYDIALDTSQRSPEEACKVVLDSLKSNVTFSAFTKNHILINRKHNFLKTKLTFTLQRIE